MKYASHGFFCVLLSVAWFGAEVYSKERWFLAAASLWCTVMLVAAMIVDVKHMKYSSWSNGDLSRLDVKAVLFVLGILALNLMASICGHMLRTKVFGFNFSLELGTAAVFHFIWNAVDLQWNLQAKSAVSDILEKNLKVNLSKHMWWSFFLSNIGTPTRTYMRVLLFSFAQVLHVDWFPAIVPDEWFIYVSIMSIFYFVPIATQFYFFHRLLHSNSTLYALVHKVHHLSRYPIPSDTGAVSPIEMLMTNVNFLTMCAPFPVWCFAEAITFIRFRWAHDFSRDVEQDHVLHHIDNRGNFGVEDFLLLDRLFGTYLSPKDSSQVKKLKAQFKEAVETEKKKES